MAHTTEALAVRPVQSFIDITEPRQIVFWTRQFGVSEMQLRYAVAAAGESLDEIRAYLGIT